MENQSYHNASNAPGNDADLEVKRMKEGIERKDFQHEIEKLKLDKQVLKLENENQKLTYENQKLTYEIKCFKETVKSQETSMDTQMFIVEIEKLKSEMKVEIEKLKSEMKVENEKFKSEMKVENEKILSMDNVDNATQMMLKFENKILAFQNEKLKEINETKELKEKIEKLENKFSFLLKVEDKPSNSNERPLKKSKSTIPKMIYDSDRFIEGISRFIEGVDAMTNEYDSYAQWYDDSVSRLKSFSGGFVCPKYLLIQSDISINKKKSSVSFCCSNDVRSSDTDFFLFAQNSDAWTCANTRRVFVLHPTDPKKSLQLKPSRLLNIAILGRWISESVNLEEYGKKIKIKPRCASEYEANSLLLCAIKY